jgi:hypothetical protein
MQCSCWSYRGLVRAGQSIISAKWPTEPMEPLPEPDFKKGLERRVKATQVRLVGLTCLQDCSSNTLC